QRVAVARALLTRPDVIFADEPTGNLDSHAGAEVLSLLGRATTLYGQTIIMVTHDPMAASHARRVVLLKHGQATGEVRQPTLQNSLENAVGRSFSHADLTVIPGKDVFVGGDEVAPLLGPMSDIDGVHTASLSARTLTTGRGTSFSESSFALSPLPADAHLDSFDLVSGLRPNAPTDLVFDSSTTMDFGAEIGDEIRFAVDSVPVETGDDDTPIYRGPSHSSVTFTVVGLAEMGEDPALPGANRAQTTASGYQEYFAQQGDVIAIQIAL